MAGEQIVTRIGLGTQLFRFLWRFKFFFIIFLFIFVNIIFADIQNHQTDKIFIDIGEKLANPLSEIQNASLQIIDNQGFIDNSSGFFDNAFNFVNLFWILFFGVYVVWTWIKIFRYPFLKMNESERFYATLIGLIIYILIQEVYLALIDENIFIPFLAFWNLFKALPYVIQPVADFGGHFTNLSEGIFKTANNTCVGSTCVI